MKWIPSILILLLLLGLPLFQIDQAIGINCLVCENSLVIKSEWSNPCEREFKFTNLWLDIKPPSSLFNQVNFFFQLKNTLSVLLSHFQGTSPFCRPPPASLINLFTF